MEQIYAQSDDVLMSDVGDLKVLMSMDDGRFVELNETGREIWNLLDGQRSLGQIAEALEEVYNVERATCEAEIAKFVGILSDQLLVDLKN